MKKILCFLILAMVISGYCYSQDVELTVNISNVNLNEGVIYLAIFSNAASFKAETPEYAFELPTNATVVSQTLTLPAGDYLLSAFQDTDGDQSVNYNRLGIPRERVAISNYNGRGFPSRNFDKQKVRVDANNREYTIGLYKF